MLNENLSRSSVMIEFNRPVKTDFSRISMRALQDLKIEKRTSGSGLSSVSSGNETNSKGKMICRILVLISLTSCVSGTFVVKVNQTSYQAEENHDITLEWMFTTKPDSSSSSLYIYCELITDQKNPLLYDVYEGFEVPEAQDKQFAGRVQSDKDALREGRIRLHVSRLRTDDSGLYICEVKTDDGVSSDSCLLRVTAAVDQPEPQNSIERPQPERQGRIGLYVGLIAAGLIVCAGLCFTFRLWSNPDGRDQAEEHELENMDAAE